jgi:hypothetical protein
MKIRNNTLMVIFFLVIILLLAGGVWGLLHSINLGIRQFQSEVAPLQGLAQKMSTQVSQLANPTPTILADPITIIHSVRSLARLETIQYSVEKVITAESGQAPFGFLFGDKLLLVAHGIVIAGVDLEKLKPQDLQLENGVLLVKLPSPEIFVATLDNDKTYVYNRETGLLTKGNVHLESDARRAAEEAIRQAAITDGILDLAKNNAESYLIRLFLALGYRDVVFQ